jgi:hypothetical protein
MAGAVHNVTPVTARYFTLHIEEKEEEYIAAAVGAGGPRWRVVTASRRHLRRPSQPQSDGDFNLGDHEGQKSSSSRKRGSSRVFD